jgi:hypothetical protein
LHLQNSASPPSSIPPEFLVSMLPELSCLPPLPASASPSPPPPWVSRIYKLSPPHAVSLLVLVAIVYISSPGGATAATGTTTPHTWRRYDAIFSLGDSYSRRCSSGRRAAARSSSATRWLEGAAARACASATTAALAWILAGGIDTGIPGALARRPRSPILASGRGRMARGIPSLDFTEAVGRRFSFFL